LGEEGCEGKVGRRKLKGEDWKGKDSLATI